MLRAYDKATGEEVGEVYMPAPQSGSPMTYVLGGTQYIVVRRQRRRCGGRIARVPTAGVAAGSSDPSHVTGYRLVLPTHPCIMMFAVWRPLTSLRTLARL